MSRTILRRCMSAGFGFVALALLVLPTGCGEQDLYAPPDSPIGVIARLPLPSITEDVSVLGNFAYVAGGEAGLHVVDLRDPARPVLLSTINTTRYAYSVETASTVYPTGVYDIAFVVEGTEGITTYDITNPESSHSFNQGGGAVDGEALHIEVPDDPSRPFLVYQAESWHGIRIFKQDPSTPGLVNSTGAFTSTRGFAKGICAVNGWAYVADDEMGLAVIDCRVVELGSVRMVSATDTPGTARAVTVVDGYAYVADGLNGLAILRVDGGAAPVMVAQIPLPGLSRSVAVRDGRAYLAAQDGGVHIVDITNPSAPVLAGTVVTTYATGVAVANSGLVVASDRTEGLVILGGQPAFVDRTPPAMIRDLTAEAQGSVSVRLQWTAPGDDQFTGAAARYEVRRAALPITADNWGEALLVAGAPAPSRCGSRESFCFGGLPVGEQIYFAMRAYDGAGNASGVSNVPAATTASSNVPPTLTDVSVTPAFGSPGTLFTFEVTYLDGDGDAPASADLVLGGEHHAMTPSSGGALCGARYSVALTLPLGVYEHSFVFDDGNEHVVSTDPVVGPLAGEAFFTMGSPEDEPGREADEPLHTVVFSRAFHLEDHEVTQAEYEAVMGTNPSLHVGADLPVENVTWYDAIRYCNARSIQEGLSPAYGIDGESVTWTRDANGYRLPTEAEWEYACRGGTTTAFSSGAITRETCDLDPALDAVGWYCGNAGTEGPHPVKQKQAGPTGLYDLHGNVAEWCWDYYGPLDAGLAGDPAGPETGMQRVTRGGHWYYFARDCRSAARGAYWPESGDDLVGFRVARND